MQKITESPRKQKIEELWGLSITKLFQEWHWGKNLKHQEIAQRVGLPRPTVTRWFKALNIPSQPGTRFTNLNLLNVGPRKTPPAKPKIKKPRPWKVNVEFFNKWSADMAYVLGFFCADGCMFVNPRGSHYISFNITDKDLLTNLKNLLGAGHKLSLKRSGNKNWKPSWNIQIGSKDIFKRLIALGITPKKAHRIRMPNVPNKYVADFIRGYFDGDGGVWSGFTHKTARKTPTRVLISTFTSCSKGMLTDIAKNLHAFAGIVAKKPTFHDGAFRLHYSTGDSKKFYQFLYQPATNLYLERKRIIFEKHLGP